MQARIVDIYIPATKFLAVKDLAKLVLDSFRCHAGKACRCFCSSLSESLGVSLVDVHDAVSCGDKTDGGCGRANRRITCCICLSFDKTALSERRCRVQQKKQLVMSSWSCVSVSVLSLLTG